MAAKKYPLGIAFSGGGAKAAAHCGALQALKEYGIQPDIVSGTSAGALVAVLYASGFTPKQMVETFQGLNFFKDIVTPSVPKGGLFDSRPLMELIQKKLPYNRLEELPIPTFIVASDIEHGVPKVFTKGEIAPRVVASCSIPVIFQPKCINGIHYIDGGAFQNLPVSAIRQKCEKVIALNLNHLEVDKYKDNLISVAYRSFMMTILSNVAADTAQADLFIELDTYGCTAYDMSKIEDLFFRGYESTVKALEENGYQRVIPKETISFPKKRRMKDSIKSPEIMFHNTIQKGMTAIKAIGKNTKKEKLPMKVGLFIDTWYPMVDGVIKVVDNYARRARGFDRNEDEKLPYQVVRCSSLSLITRDYDLPTPVLDPRFEAQLIKSGIDIVHIHSPFAVGMAGVLYAKIHKLPVVATLHSQYKQDFEKSLKLKLAMDIAMDTIMRVFNACDECWAVNGGIKDLYVQEYGLTAPCKVRLNATDHHPVPDPFAAAVNETYGIPSDATVFLFVGRINFIKNIDFTIRALAKAKAMGLKNFRMLFAGKGQDEEKLAALVQEQGLTEEVVMCGLTDKEMLENLYSRAKLFLFPSLYDANSLVQIEAACQGTPTVFLEGARTAATVTPGVNGYVCPPDEDSYARMIMDIMADPEAYERISAAARRDLYLNWDDVVRDVYEDYCTFVKANHH